MTHPNSKQSFRKLDRKTRYKAILAAYKGRKQYTDRDIKYALGLTDMNYVRPRITELIRANRLVEVGKRYDVLTKRNVRLTVKVRR